MFIESIKLLIINVSLFLHNLAWERHVWVSFPSSITHLSTILETSTTVVTGSLLKKKTNNYNKTFLPKLREMRLFLNLKKDNNWKQQENAKSPNHSDHYMHFFKLQTDKNNFMPSWLVSNTVNYCPDSKHPQENRWQDTCTGTWFNLLNRKTYPLGISTAYNLVQYVGSGLLITFNSVTHAYATCRSSTKYWIIPNLLSKYTTLQFRFVILVYSLLKYPTSVTIALWNFSTGTSLSSETPDFLKTSFSLAVGSKVVSLPPIPQFVTVRVTLNAL